MSQLPLLPLEELCPRSDLDEGVDEGIDCDLETGTYLKICRGNLLPIAVIDMGAYREHDLVSQEEAQRRYDKDSRIAVVPVKEWYRSHPPF